MTNPRIPFRMSSERARLAAPGGKPLIVHIVVNVEHWQFDQPMPRKIITPPHGIDSVPDVPNFACGKTENRDSLHFRDICKAAIFRSKARVPEHRPISIMNRAGFL